ncbi:peptide chain release factor 1 [Candidatus Micrarchaeota archaeon CG10_big_fil_rev_8_21_14_0_10_45_29]|nr:MAG: peptide chain release factor 1 [Candidatus Micrarchaeota archaeon CG10_big_fil_rev_8_21_14_0_10_45_29]
MQQKKEDEAERKRNMYLLKKQLHHLKEMRGSGTELISVYMPSGAQVHATSNKLKEEAGQASNIKSKGTRKSVMDALERIIHHLKTYGHNAPESGIAIFCGNVSDNPSKTDIQLFTIFPPEPLKIQTYRCDSKFFLEPLEQMLDIKDSYGLVVLDGRECTIALLRGTNIKILQRLNSTAHAKIRKGGQSAARYARLIEESIEYYYKRIGEAMDRYFVNTVKGVIIGGPGPAKHDFAKMKPYNYQIKVLGVLDTGYTDEHGLREVMAQSSKIIENQQAIVEKEIIDKFIKEVVSGGLATYGEANVRKALESKQASTLLISEGLAWKRYHVKIDDEEKYMNLRAGEQLPKVDAHGRKIIVLSEHDLQDNLIELADASGTKIEMVSTETSEGAQFFQSFYGIGAFLRYK